MTVPIPSPARTRWDRRLARYRWLAARADRVATSGWFRDANDRHYRDVAAAETRLGTRKEAQSSPEGTKLWDAIWGRLVDAEDLYWEQCSAPMVKAAIALVLTPAPDADALIAKLRVMRERELETFEGMQRHPLQVLEVDVAGLASSFPDQRSFSNA